MPTTRSAALIATAVAVPVAVLAGFLMINSVGGTPTAAPAPAPSRIQSTDAVSVPAPKLDERAAVVCLALTSQLPDQLRDLARRPVTEGPEQNAAYGDPAITVTCGGPAPSIGPTDELTLTDGVCWHSAVLPDERAAFTAAGREVPVVVTVPAAYAGAGEWAFEFSDTIVQTVPSSTAAPTGCRN